MLEKLEVFVDGEAYLVYFHYYPGERNYPREPDVPEEIEIDSVYKLLEFIGPQDEAKLKQELFMERRENEDGTSD